MNLIRRKRENWDPFDLLTDLQTDLNRVFDRTRTRRGDGFFRSFEPDIEMTEESDRFLVKADVPGLKKEDLNIQVENSTLVIRGERKEEKKSKKQGQHYSERYYGSFSRAIGLPSEIQADKVKASYKDGVLEIALPKSESARPKQITVEVK